MSVSLKKDLLHQMNKAIWQAHYKEMTSEHIKDKFMSNACFCSSNWSIELRKIMPTYKFGVFCIINIFLKATQFNFFVKYL